MKPENDLGDPPVFKVLGLPFVGVGIGRGADLAGEEGLVC